ncbi:MAG: PDZ domain-containing protein [Acetobacteraceae bacterium]|nr:PDZ domain-containing protein [Acetobacteraceae bacterium]
MLNQSDQKEAGRETGNLGGLDDRPPPLHVLLEVARLAAVRSYAVLDRSDLPELDGIAQAAAHATGRPMGGVGFLDEARVWYAGAHDLPWREMVRPCSFCELALLQPTPLVIHDASLDPRFRDHPDVGSERGLRFYAGAPVLDEDHYRVGTVCVFDTQPGQASAEALNDLLRLSFEASAVLAVRRRMLALAAVDPSLVQGWLGVRTRSARLRPRDRKPGLVVLGVAPSSPAEQAGVRPTDILLSIDEQPLWRPPDVVAALANRARDSLARVQILRIGQILELLVPIMPQPGTGGG